MTFLWFLFEGEEYLEAFFLGPPLQVGAGRSCKASNRNQKKKKTPHLTHRRATGNNQPPPLPLVMGPPSAPGLFRSFTASLLSGTRWRSPGCPRCPQCPSPRTGSTIIRRQANSSSSNIWLRRQMGDPYTRKATLLRLKSRAAFKLLEIHHDYHIFRPRQTVVDLVPSPLLPSPARHSLLSSPLLSSPLSSPHLSPPLLLDVDANGRLGRDSRLDRGVRCVSLHRP